jgi:hypothetical protein
VIYVTGFVAPAERRDGLVSLEQDRQAVLCQAACRLRAATGAGRDRIIVLQLDNAG